MSYDEALEIMVKFELDGKDIGRLYEKVIADKGTRINREQFVIKLASIIKYLGFERNIGINKGCNGFIKKENILQSIEKYTRMMVKDVETLKQKCQIIQQELQLDNVLMNEILKAGLYVYSTGLNKLYMSICILKQFQVRMEEYGIINAGQYLLMNNQSKIVISSKKLYYRLMYIGEKYGSFCIDRIEFDSCLREQVRFESKYETKDEILEKRYVLPGFNPEKPEDFKRQIEQEVNEQINQQAEL